MVEVNYENLSEFQCGIKRGIILTVRAFLDHLPLEVRTHELIVKTVEKIWTDYIEDK